MTNTEMLVAKKCAEINKAVSNEIARLERAASMADKRTEDIANAAISFMHAQNDADEFEANHTIYKLTGDEEKQYNDLLVKKFKRYEELMRLAQRVVAR